MLFFFFLALSAIIHHKSLSRETYFKHVLNLSQKKKVIKPRRILKNVFRDILGKFMVVLISFSFPFLLLFVFFKRNKQNQLSMQAWHCITGVLPSSPFCAMNKNYQRRISTSWRRQITWWMFKTKKPSKFDGCWANKAAGYHSSIPSSVTVMTYFYIFS